MIVVETMGNGKKEKKIPLMRKQEKEKVSARGSFGELFANARIRRC